jgi:hypothetical protein
VFSKVILVVGPESRNTAKSILRCAHAANVQPCQRSVAGGCQIDSKPCRRIRRLPQVALTANPGPGFKSRRPFQSLYRVTDERSLSATSTVRFLRKQLVFLQEREQHPKTTAADRFVLAKPARIFAAFRRFWRWKSPDAEVRDLQRFVPASLCPLYGMISTGSASMTCGSLIRF